MKSSVIDKNKKNINMFLYNFDEKDILTTAIEQASVAIVLTDIEANIIYVNPAFEKISGYLAEELIGENPRIVKSEQRLTKKCGKLFLMVKYGMGEQINKRKDRSLYYEDSRITPIYDKNNTALKSKYSSR